MAKALKNKTLIGIVIGLLVVYVLATSYLREGLDGPATYTEYPNTDIGGDNADIKLFKGSLDQCKAECTKTGGCTGFVRVNKDNECYLKNANAKQSKYNANGTTYSTVPVVMANSREYTKTDNVDHTSVSPFTAVRVAGDLNECKKACDNTKDCNGFAKGSGNECYLKKIDPTVRGTFAQGVNFYYTASPITYPAASGSGSAASGSASGSGSAASDSASGGAASGSGSAASGSASGSGSAASGSASGSGSAASSDEKKEEGLSGEAIALIVIGSLLGLGLIGGLIYSMSKSRSAGPPPYYGRGRR